MEKGVLKYGEYDGEQSEPIRVDRDRESQTRVKETRRKSREKSGFNKLNMQLMLSIEQLLDTGLEQEPSRVLQLSLVLQISTLPHIVHLFSISSQIVII